MNPQSFAKVCQMTLVGLTRKTPKFYLIRYVWAKCVLSSCLRWDACTGNGASNGQLESRRTIKYGTTLFTN